MDKISFQLSKAIPMVGYYVYVITENGIICYVGKGKKNRVLSHFSNSSNILLASKIKENKSIFDWGILETFQDEFESLLYEKNIINNLIIDRIKLYNTVYNHTSKKKGEFFKSIFQLFKQYEERIFPSTISNNPLSIFPEIIINMIKENCKDMDTENIPTYRSKKLNELSFYIRPEYGKNRVVFC